MAGNQFCMWDMPDGSVTRNLEQSAQAWAKEAYALREKLKGMESFPSLYSDKTPLLGDTFTHIHSGRAWACIGIVRRKRVGASEVVTLEIQPVDSVHKEG